MSIDVKNADMSVRFLKRLETAALMFVRSAAPRKQKKCFPLFQRDPAAPRRVSRVVRREPVRCHKRGVASTGFVMSRPANDFYERIKHRLHERIGRHLRLAGTVVDMGCGACDLVEYLAQTYRQKVIGVDISPDSFPSRRSTRAGVLFQCVAADATRIDFTRENSVDAIVSMWALHEMKHPEAILAEALRILRPGGELLMRVTNRNRMARLHHSASALTFRGRQLVEMPFWTTDDAISCHSRKSLTKLMNKTGFRIIKLTCLEKGKKIDSFGLRFFYQFTSTLARITAERACLTPGIICIAKKGA